MTASALSHETWKFLKTFQIDNKHRIIFLTEVFKACSQQSKLVFCFHSPSSVGQIESFSPFLEKTFENFSTPFLIVSMLDKILFLKSDWNGKNPRDYFELSKAQIVLHRKTSNVQK